jgi:hypothetical protein
VTRESAVRKYVLHSHEELLATVLGCADCVAESWDSDATTDSQHVVEPFKRALDERGVVDRLPGVLVDAVDALGENLSAEPVAAPPYLAITSVGPVLRATLSSARLVITVRAFAIERDPVRYVRGPATPADALSVALKNR